jgi:hypothetical protein
VSAAWNFNREIGLFYHFADYALAGFAQNIFEWRIQITVKTKISSHSMSPHNYGVIVQFEEGIPACT